MRCYDSHRYNAGSDRGEKLDRIITRIFFTVIGILMLAVVFAQIGIAHQHRTRCSQEMSNGAYGEDCP